MTQRLTLAGSSAVFTVAAALCVPQSGSAQAPATLGLAYTADYVSVVAGGAARGATYLDNTDLTLGVDLEDLLGWGGAELFVYVLGNRGGSPSELAGDLQTLSNLDAPDTWKLYEAWLDQTFLSGGLSVRAGLYDLNSEFDVIETAAPFLNSSHGIGPDFSQTGLNGPSIFPTTSLGARVLVSPTPHLRLMGVVLDGVPGDPDDPFGTHIDIAAADGVLVAGELSVLGGGRGPSSPKVALGGYLYSGTVDCIHRLPGGTPGRCRGRGAYLLAEGALRPEAADVDQGLAAFGRVGVSNAKAAQIGRYVGAGLVYTGLLPGRDRDQAGFAAAWAENGADYLSRQESLDVRPERGELALELMYSVHLTSEWTIQPDLQFIINPGTDPTLADAFVVGVRTSIEF